MRYGTLGQSGGAVATVEQGGSRRATGSEGNPVRLRRDVQAHGDARHAGAGCDHHQHRRDVRGRLGWLQLCAGRENPYADDRAAPVRHDLRRALSRHDGRFRTQRCLHRPGRKPAPAIRRHSLPLHHCRLGQRTGAAEQVRAQHRGARRGRRRSAVPSVCAAGAVRPALHDPHRDRGAVGRVPSSRTARSSSCCTATRGSANDCDRSSSRSVTSAAFRPTPATSTTRASRRAPDATNAKSCSRSSSCTRTTAASCSTSRSITDAYAPTPAEVETPDLEWQIRSDGQPLAPWLTFRRIINPWGLSGFPIHLRLKEGSLTELVVRFVGPDPVPVRCLSSLPLVQQVGGRLLGRFWYNTKFGGR